MEPLPHVSAVHFSAVALFRAVLPRPIILRHSCVTMSKPQGTFKLRVKIDGQEFEAEGQSDLVSRQFEAFRLMLQEAGSASVRHVDHSDTGRPFRPVAPQDVHAQAGRHDVDLTKLFQVSPQTQLLSLRQPPGGEYPEADAVLLLLLGHKRLRNEEDVPVTVLTEALKQSGCPVKRLDRILTIYTKDHSVLRSGRGKGGKYRLTNLGLKTVDAIAGKLCSEA